MLRLDLLSPQTVKVHCGASFALDAVTAFRGQVAGTVRGNAPGLAAAAFVRDVLPRMAERVRDVTVDLVVQGRMIDIDDLRDLAQVTVEDINMGNEVLARVFPFYGSLTRRLLDGRRRTCFSGLQRRYGRLLGVRPSLGSRDMR